MFRAERKANTAFDPHYLTRLVPAEGSTLAVSHPPPGGWLIFMSRAIIFANGRIENLERARGLLREKDVLIAADGGTRHVLRLGRMPAVLVGDLDSLSPRELERAKTGGCKIVQHPRDKDETDFELALRYAVEAGYSHILVIGALGGRLDQTLGNLSLLSGTECASLDIALDDGTERAWFVRQATEIQGQAGDLISLQIGRASCRERV